MLPLLYPYSLHSRRMLQTLLSSNFDDGTSTGWTSTSGTWSVVQDAGNYVYSQSSTSEGRTSAGNQAWTDYSVQANVKVDNFNGSNRAYVAGRYLDGNNFYAASLYNSSGGKLEIRKKVSGSTTTLVSKSNYTLDDWNLVHGQIGNDPVQQSTCMSMVF